MKCRHWSSILYPESMKENFIEILEESGISCAISPLHDKDLNANGEKKKAHYHILFNFPGPTTYNRVKSICQEIGSVEPKQVISIRGYYRYLCHLDNPEKAQYKVEDIKKLCGFTIDLTCTEQLALKLEILQEIKEKKFTEYRHIIDYYLSTGEVEKLDLVSRQTIFFNRYITSSRYSFSDY